jgi:hypothetical protein
VPAAARPPSAPPIASRRSCAHLPASRPQALHAGRVLRSPASPASRVRRFSRSPSALTAQQTRAAHHLAPRSKRPCQFPPLPDHDATMRGARRLCEPFRRSPTSHRSSRAAHRPNASTHRRRHPRPQRASQTRQQPAIRTPPPQSIRRSTHLTALRLPSAPPVSVAAAMHRPRPRSARHRMRSCPQRGVILRLATVRAPAAPAARPRSPHRRALNHASIQAHA